MTGLTVNIPQGYRIRLRLMVQPGHAGDPLRDLALRVTGGAQTAQVTFDVRREHRHACIAERFGQALQRDGFTGPGSARYQTVTVRQAHGLGDWLAREVSADNELR
jgi:hypothetical protein